MTYLGLVGRHIYRDTQTHREHKHTYIHTHRERDGMYTYRHFKNLDIYVHPLSILPGYLGQAGIRPDSLSTSAFFVKFTLSYRLILPAGSKRDEIVQGKALAGGRTAWKETGTRHTHCILLHAGAKDGSKAKKQDKGVT